MQFPPPLSSKASFPGAGFPTTRPLDLRFVQLQQRITSKTRDSFQQRSKKTQEMLRMVELIRLMIMRTLISLPNNPFPIQ